MEVRSKRGATPFSSAVAPRCRTVDQATVAGSDAPDAESSTVADRVGTGTSLCHRPVRNENVTRNEFSDIALLTSMFPMGVWKSPVMLFSNAW